jgi:prophage DNA circulation protein
MSYLDRLRNMIFKSPSGATFGPLGFDEVSRDGGKKMSVTELPQQDRVEAQDLGNLGQRFQVTVYIGGMDYDTTADQFFDALSEHYPDNNPGTFSHPRWGDITVKPLTFSQSEQFVEGMGEAVFAIEFIRVDSVARFPTSAADAAGGISADSDATATAGQNAYAANGVPQTPGQVAAVTSQSTNIFTAIGNGLKAVASFSDTVSQSFNEVLTGAFDTVDALVADPITLAESITTLMKTPATAELQVAAKIQAYQDLMGNLQMSVVNSYAEAELSFMSLLGCSTGAADASLIGDIGSRGDAVTASDGVDDMLTQLDDGIDSLMSQQPGWSPDGDALSRCKDLLSTVRAYLLEVSFSLKSERRRIQQWTTDALTLCREFYPGVPIDQSLAKFIADSELADDEFFQVPVGKEVVWYQ